MHEQDLHHILPTKLSTITVRNNQGNILDHATGDETQFRNRLSDEKSVDFNKYEPFSENEYFILDYFSSVQQHYLQGT